MPFAYCFPATIEREMWEDLKKLILARTAASPFHAQQANTANYIKMSCCGRLQLNESEGC